MKIDEFEKLTLEEKKSFFEDKKNKKDIFKSENIQSIIDILFTLNLSDSLFDSDGVNTLFYMPYSIQEKWVNTIMTSEIKNTLFKNKYFCMYIIDSIKKEKDFNLNISLKHNKFFFDYLINHWYKDDISTYLNVAFSMDDEGRDYLLKNFNEEKKYSYIPDISNFSSKSLEWVLNNFKINMEDYTLDQIYEIALSDVSVPTYLFENNEFLNRLNAGHNIALSRKIINDLSLNSDINLIEKHREKIFDYNLKTYNKFDMLENFYYFSEDLVKIKYNEKIIDKLVNKYFNQDNSVFKDKIKNFMYYNPNKEQIKRYLTKESDLYVSNMIIDYHFKDVYYNVLMNIKQMLDFQKENLTLSEDRIDLYNRIINIDLLSYDEKMMLHNELKNYDLVSMLYNDMFSIRKVIGNLIKDSILTKEKLKQFKNDVLSKKYGIDVYVLDGQEFYALAKTGQHHDKDEKYARSYSLLGPNALTVYNSGGIFSDAFLYDGITNEQIVHMFPTDSFTKYNSNKGSTNRVNVLMNPKNLTYNTTKYNELLILEKGKISDEMDERIPELNKIALYTYDELKDTDLEVAKKEGIGVVIVKRMKYNRKNSGIDFDKVKYYGANSQKNLDDFRESLMR